MPARNYAQSPKQMMGVKSMKILQIPTGGLFADGILSCIVEYMTAMDKSDMDIRVLATNQAEKSIVQKVEKVGCKVVSIPYRKTNIIKYFLSLYRYIAKEKIDIVLMKNYWKETNKK